MNWKKLAFGSDTPTLGRYLGYGLFYLLMASVMHGIYCNFIPNRILTGMDALLGFGLWGLIATILLIVVSIRRGKFRADGVKAYLGLLFLPILVGMFTWLVVAKSVPWLITTAVGDSYEETVTLHTSHSGGRGCHYRIEGDYVDHTFPSYLCISERYYEAHPDQDVQVTLIGPRTMLGFRVVHIQSPSSQLPEPGRSK
jgi:putative effector of murein hydrolase LrgA (UPF0299 family)